MPTYEYQCEQCQRVFEVKQRISDAPLTACEVCGGTIRRLLSSAPFILKGGGWHVTDYPSESRKKAIESEKATSTTPETKSDTKSESKSSTPTSSAPTSSSSSTES
ncbi:MAG: zinc ribbon domain-containing protein [Candidatus Rokubacteria bacterium]|nr:zinc ribbon domain-containing protein [Candidatus Rokubacteria bacterium]